MAGEYAVPLLLVTLILLAIASWRVVHPPLAFGFTGLVCTVAVLYLIFSVIPRLAAEPDPTTDVAAGPFGAVARAASGDMSIQLYRGTQLVGECALGGPDAPPARVSDPLRLERTPSGELQVWSGSTLLGDLPRSSLAALDLGRPAPAPAAVEPPPAPRPSSEPPRFFLTGKVPVGSTAWLGQMPPAGPVSVEFVRLNERGLAVVKVNAPELGPADPPTLELNNKAALTQSFQRMLFDVAIREASFIADPPWASFAVMAHDLSPDLGRP